VPLAAAAGAGEGFVYGAGEGREGERLQPAITGGTVGAVAGAAIPAGGLLLKGLTEATIRRIKGVDAKTTQEILSRELGKEVDIDTARIFQTALAYEDMPSAQRVLDRLGESGMIADISPGSAAVLDAMMAGSPAAMNAGRMAVEGRTTKAMRDLGQKFDDELGLPADPEDIKIGIAQETAAERDQLYSAAFALPIDYASPSGQRLETLFQRVQQSAPEAVKNANQMMAAQGWENRQIKAIVDEQGNVTIETPPDILQLDYITRELNDKAESFKRSGEMGKAGVFSKLSKDIRDELKTSTPEYAAALKAGQDKIKRQEAIDLGFDLIDPQVTRGEVIRKIRGMTPEQKAEMARGLRSRIDEELSNIAQIASDPNLDAVELRQVIRKMSSNAFKTKLGHAVGAKKAASLIRQIDDGLSALQLRAAVAVNSKTAQRQAAIGETEQILQGGILNALKRGQPVDTSKLIIQALTGATEEAQAVRRAGIFEEMTQVLTQIRGRGAKDALKLIDKAMKGQPLKDAEARFIANVITMPSAVALYTAGRPEQEKQ